MIASNISKLIPKVKSPLQAAIIAQGIITAAEPKIGRASINAIPSAAISGYCTFIPKNLNIYNPIKDIINDTITNIASAFNKPPNDFTISLICFVNFFTHNSGK